MLKKILKKLKRETLKWEMIKTSNLARMLEKLPDYPSSSSSNKQFLELTVLGASQSYRQLVELSGKKPLEILDLVEYLERDKDLNFTDHLKRLFKEHGSDKATTHDYYLLYSQVLQKFPSSKIDILEIGIGSNNLDVPSNMGQLGVPGASLRAFRDINKDFHIIGADVDPRILFSDERIETTLLDQTNDSSWSEFRKFLHGRKFNLIIDDGLHSPIANLNTVKYLVDDLKPNGVLIVEDIHKRSLPVWEIFEVLTSDRLQLQMLKTKSAYVAVITKPNQVETK
jgi:hypothetical protein